MPRETEALSSKWLTIKKYEIVLEGPSNHPGFFNVQPTARGGSSDSCSFVRYPR